MYKGVSRFLTRLKTKVANFSNFLRIRTRKQIGVDEGDRVHPIGMKGLGHLLGACAPLRYRPRLSKIGYPKLRSKRNIGLPFGSAKAITRDSSLCVKAVRSSYLCQMPVG
jgi:hypothetical protein